MNLYNSNNEKIGNYIAEGRTEAFLVREYGTLLNCRKQAIDFAKRLKSYIYPVFIRRNNKLKLRGYGVPH